MCLYSYTIIFCDSRVALKRGKIRSQTAIEKATHKPSRLRSLHKDSHNSLRFRDFVIGFSPSRDIIIPVFRLKAIPTIAILEIAIFRDGGRPVASQETRDEQPRKNRSRDPGARGRK